MTEHDNQTSRPASDLPSGDRALRPARAARRTGMALLRVALIGYAALLGTLMLAESRLVYPGVYLVDAEDLARVAGDHRVVDIEYVSDDGVNLRGRLLDRPDLRHTVLFFHGNASHAKLLDSLCVRLSEVFDATVMVAEYRGFGGVGPTPTESGVLADASAAMRCLCQLRKIDPQEVIVIGRSLGGACAVSVAAEHGAAALVLDRTFDSTVNIASGRFPFIPVRFMMRNRFDSASRIGHYHGPLFQVHGTVDSVVPIENGRVLFDVANEPKRWIEIPGLEHNDRIPPKDFEQLARWVQQSVTESSPTLAEPSHVRCRPAPYEFDRVATSTLRFPFGGPRTTFTSKPTSTSRSRTARLTQ